MSASTAASERGGDAPSEAAVIAAAVLGVDGVLAMSAGPVGQFRSYLPGGATVPGVRLDDAAVTLNVVCRYDPALASIGESVGSALAALTGGREVTVVIDDIVLPGETEPERAESVVEPARAGTPGSAPAEAQPMTTATMTDHDDALRRARRAFIRAEHPDAGGDPQRFIDGLAAFDARHPGIADPAPAPSASSRPAPRMQVYRSKRLDRVVLRAVRDLRRRAGGTPTRRLR